MGRQTKTIKSKNTGCLEFEILLKTSVDNLTYDKKYFVKDSFTDRKDGLLGVEKVLKLSGNW